MQNITRFNSIDDTESWDVRRRLQLEPGEPRDSTQYEETESEPEDLAPEREDEMGVAGAADPPLDSSDDEPDDDSELTTFESALPAGMCMADAPLPAQLDFKNLAGERSCKARP